MQTRLFVGGLPWSITSEEVRKIFSEVGVVVSADVVMDRATGRSKGFAFVDMETPEAAQLAIERLDGTEVGGRRMAVSIARPKEERPPRQQGFRNDYRRAA